MESIVDFLGWILEQAHWLAGVLLVGVVAGFGKLLAEWIVKRRKAPARAHTRPAGFPEEAERAAGQAAEAGDDSSKKARKERLKREKKERKALLKKLKKGGPSPSA